MIYLLSRLLDNLNYLKMKKTLVLSLSVLLLGSSLAFAQTDGTTTPVATTISFDANIACVQTAVKAREASIGSAFTTFSTSISSALTTRASALETAWGTSDAKTRRTLRNEAWTNYKRANQSAKATFKTSKKSAWDTFKKASKACKTAVVESESNDSLSI